jgi:hypothetical protein
VGIVSVGKVAVVKGVGSRGLGRDVKRTAGKRAGREHGRGVSGPISVAGHGRFNAFNDNLNFAMEGACWAAFVSHTGPLDEDG